MKKALLLITAIFLVFGGCKKDVVPEATKVQIEKETIEKGSNYVKISAEYEYPEVLTSVILYLSEKEDTTLEKLSFLTRSLTVFIAARPTPRETAIPISAASQFISTSPVRAAGTSRIFAARTAGTPMMKEKATA